MKSNSLAIFLVLSALSLTPLSASTIVFTLGGDPHQNYSFLRQDTSSPSLVTEPVGPYPGYLGAITPENYYGFLCIDYLKTAVWNTSYAGESYGVGDLIPGKSSDQLLEAAYLANKLYFLGGSHASTTLYQGPISLAVWQIMDPTPSHVPWDAAAQPYVAEAQDAFNAGLLHSSDFPNVRVFVPDSQGIQSFMTVTSASPEPETIALIGGGILMIVLGRLRFGGGRQDENTSPEKQG